MELLQIIDIAGTAAFSIAGVFAAMEKKLDLFGILIIAFVTALGGGTLRDLLIGNVPVSWMHQLHYGLIVMVSAITALLFTNLLKNLHNILLLFDSLGLGLFTLVGIQKGIDLQLHSGICILLGTITACFGGVLRDVLLNQIPLIFQKEIYATACIGGGMVYFLLLYTGAQGWPIDIICILVIVLSRFLAVKYNWSLPVINKLKNERNEDN